MAKTTKEPKPKSVAELLAEADAIRQRGAAAEQAEVDEATLAAWRRYVRLLVDGPGPDDSPTDLSFLLEDLAITAEQSARDAELAQMVSDAEEALADRADAAAALSEARAEIKAAEKAHEAKMKDLRHKLSAATGRAFRAADAPEKLRAWARERPELFDAAEPGGLPRLRR